MRGLDSLRQLSDEELARVAAGGDENAARVLLERFEEPLYRYTVALVRDPDIAREATWSALFEAARAVRAGEHSEPVRPWILRVAHTAADVAGGRPEGLGPADRTPAVEQPAALATAPGAPDWERLDRLLTGLDALPDRDRSSFLLRELVGLEYVGIATVTGARAAAARQSVFRARQALQGGVEPPTEHCLEIQAAMSKAETGIRERRSIALHLETCPVCEEFASELERRPGDLRTLFPAPPEPLAAELMPPLPPPVAAARGGGRGGFMGRGRAGRGRGGGGAVGAGLGGAGAGRARGRDGRRRGALVPLVLALLLAGAAVATALALNDNGGGKHGRAAAAGGTQARGPAGSGGAGGSSAAGGPKGKSHAAKPHTRAHAKPSHPKAAKPSQPKAAKPSHPKAVAPSHPKGSKPGRPSGSNPAQPSGSKPGGAGGSHAGTPGSGAGGNAGGSAKRHSRCRSAPVASPAQSGYGSQAGVAQATVEPCAHGASGGSGLAHTGLDIALVLACGALLMALGASLRRLGVRT